MNCSIFFFSHPFHFPLSWTLLHFVVPQLLHIQIKLKKARKRKGWKQTAWKIMSHIFQSFIFTTVSSSLFQLLPFLFNYNGSRWFGIIMNSATRKTETNQWKFTRKQDKQTFEFEKIERTFFLILCFFYQRFRWIQKIFIIFSSLENWLIKKLYLFIYFRLQYRENSHFLIQRKQERKIVINY